MRSGTCWQPRSLSTPSTAMRATPPPEAEAAIEQSTADYLAWLDKFQAT